MTLRNRLIRKLAETMATNKNQHYVPRCYLRPFSQDAGNAAINLYNIDRDRLIVGAAVKKQCSGSYFYGKDTKLEAALQFMEQSYAGTVRALLTPGYQLNERDKAVLRKFWLLQYMRTDAASRRFVSISNDLAEGIGPGAEDIRIQLREAVELSMRAFADTMNVVDDLKVCLIRNRSTVPFVTSDDPAVMTNRWHFVDQRVVWKTFGLGASGCLLLLPLSPTVLCLVYDGDVYSITHANGWTETRRAADVIALNQHQFLNCRANIFLGDADNIDGVRSQWFAAVPLRPAARHEIFFAVRDGEEDGYETYKVVSAARAREECRALMHVRPIHARPTAWPQFLQWRSKGRVYTNGSAAGYVRRAHIRFDTQQPFHEEIARPR